MNGLRVNRDGPHLSGALPPDRFAAEVLEVERELDELHPVWRQPRPRGRRRKPGIMGTQGIHLDATELRMRVKYLLQRRKNLYAGHDTPVAVRLVERRLGPPRVVAFSDPRARRAHHRQMRKADQAMTKRGATLDQVAKAVGRPRHEVARAALDCPEHVDLLDHVRRKFNTTEEPTP